jgi:hypothetical protein
MYLTNAKKKTKVIIFPVYVVCEYLSEAIIQNADPSFSGGMYMHVKHQ